MANALGAAGRYLARVELHERFPAEQIDYQPLHVAMSVNGYEQIIHDDDGKEYQLPSGTYYGKSVSLEHAQNAVVTALKTLLNPGTFVIVEFGRAV